jgi:Tfp pilus assembly protein PilF
MAKRKALHPNAVSWVPRSPWAIAVLFVAACALYWGTLRNPPVFDDVQLSERFLRTYGSSLFNLDLRWLSYATFGWTFDVVGRDWTWYRLGNVLLHAASASVLFLFLARLFAVAIPVPAPQARATIEPAWMALFGALLFLVHPVAAYGVAYLIQRPIVMATLFGLLSLWLFLEGLIRNAHGWFIASAVAYFAAVFSKEHCVMLPAVAAALAVLVRGWPPRPLRALALPLALYAAIAALVVLRSKGLLGIQYEPFADSAVRQLAVPDGTAGQSGLYALSVINQGYLYFRYLLTWLLPFPGWMSIDLRFGFPAQLASWPHAAGFLAWFAWPVIAAALLVRGGRAALAGFAMLGPWLLALPEVATVRVQEPFVLYRSYLWMSLLPAAIPALVARLPLRWGYALLAAACLALLPPLFDRLATFSSEYSLWDDAIRKNTNLNAAYVDRGYRNRGVAEYHAGRYRDALRDFNRALELDPRNPRSWQLRGALNTRVGQNERALVDLGRALELDPGNAEALGPRCVVLMRLQRLDEALADCTQALESSPDEIDNSISIGMVRALRGETERAERHYRRALQIDPASAVARYQYGVLLKGLGRNAEAQEQFLAACGARMQVACRAIERPGAAK